MRLVTVAGRASWRPGAVAVTAMPEDPFKDFKNIPPLDEILKASFNRANKRAEATSNKGPSLKVARTKETRKIEIACQYVMEVLDKIVKSVPDLSKLPPFYYDLSQVLVDNDQFKQKLGRISGTIRVIEKMKKEQIRKAIASKTVREVHEARKQAFGRLKSMLDRLHDDFEYLAGTRKKLKALPVVDLGAPGVVFAGYPNVGKSSCINNLCGSNIQVAQYPFTTKEVKVGIFKDGFDLIQFIDTPGILDRPVHMRNQIEQQAIVAMKHVAQLIVFVIDPTLSSGYGVREQLDLLREVRDTFPGVPRLVLVNKVDLDAGTGIPDVKRELASTGEHDVVEYSATSRTNEVAFLKAIKDRVKGFDAS